MTYLKTGAVIVLLLGTASCASNETSYNYGLSDGFVTVGEHYASGIPPMDPGRRVSEQDCSRPFAFDGGNLRCR
jgi:hypothetical protein